MAHCQSNVAASTSELQTEDWAFLGTLAATGDSTWRCTVNLNGMDTQFKLDTGAEVTAVSEWTYKSLGLKGRLQAPSKALYGPSNKSLRVLDQFEGELRYKERSSREVIFIARGLKNDLLGLPALMALQLVQKLEATYSSPSDVRQEFPSVHWTGKLWQAILD